MACPKNFMPLLALILASGCYPGISGKVVEADTGKPIPSAVVVAEWTTTGGLPGLTHHNVYKTIETETDGEGIFHLSGVYLPFVDEPAMVIFKRGYVPWRNDGDFEKMEDFDKVIWKDQEIYRLRKLKDDYARGYLDSFISSKFLGIDTQHTPIFQHILAETSRDAREEYQRQKKMQGSRSR